jgi:hypothetical protein
MRPVRSTGPRAPRPRHDDFPLPFPVLAAKDGGEQAGEEEEYAVHDAEGPARLEHGARLVGGDAIGVEVGLGEDAQGERVALGRGAGAIVAADVAQGADAADEGADDAQVDEGDEVGVVARAVVGEEGEDAPDGGEDGDDEEDEDGGGREAVLLVVDVHEVGEHAEGWDLGRGEGSAPVRWRGGEGEEELGRGRRGLTRVIISMKRQKVKKSSNIMIAAVKVRPL